MKCTSCREVRRQTCDLVTLMDVAEPLSHYFMFMEDDFRCSCLLCQCCRCMRSSACSSTLLFRTYLKCAQLAAMQVSMLHQLATGSRCQAVSLDDALPTTLLLSSPRTTASHCHSLLLHQMHLKGAAVLYWWATSKRLSV